MTSAETKVNPNPAGGVGPAVEPGPATNPAGRAKPACVTCRFWEISTDDANEGSCKRYPPHIVMRILDADDEVPYPCATFPVVDFDDWCGEWQGEQSNPSKDDREIVFDIQKRLDTKDTRVARAVAMVRKHKPNGYTADDICRIHRIPHNAKLWQYVHEAWEDIGSTE